MHIKRDYSQSFFGEKRRPRRNYTRILFVFGLMIGALLVYVSVNFGTLQEQALDSLGFGPTATPLPGDLANLADQYRIAGDLDDARDMFERAIAQRPNDVAYLYEYGRLLVDMGEPEEAIDLGDTIIELAPDDPRGYALRSRAEVWTGNASRAVTTALAGLDLQAGYESALYSVLARAYTNIGQYEDGVESGGLAVQIDPMSADARRSYAYSLSWVSANQEAVEQLEAAIVIAPTNIDAYLELALQYLAQNRDQEAIDLYDQVLAIQPRNAQAFRRLCGAYRKIGEFERALGYCQDAVAANPESLGAQYDLGILQYNRFDFPAALESFANCVAIDPANLACKHRLGLTYFYVGDCDNAWETLQDSLLMAQTAQGEGQDVSGIIDNIREGLVGIGQTCPQYGGVLPTPTPSPTPEGFVAPEATQDPTVDPNPGV